MTKAFNKALDAVSNMRPPLPDLHMGQRVVERGGNGSILVIAGFDSIARGEWEARCLRLGTSDVVVLPVHLCKPADQPTYH